jgi:hypothetical protein
MTAWLREIQEQVFDAHKRAFAFFGGVPRRGTWLQPSLLYTTPSAASEH